MKLISILLVLVFAKTSFAASPVGNWSVNGVRCHLGNEYTQTPFDPANTRIVWSFKSNSQYQINVQKNSFSYLERGNFATNSARICLRAFDGYSSEDGYRRYDGSQACGSFVATESTLKLLLEIRDPVGQGCPIGDLLEITYAKLPTE